MQDGFTLRCCFLFVGTTTMYCIAAIRLTQRQSKPALGTQMAHNIDPLALGSPRGSIKYVIIIFGQSSRSSVHFFKGPQMLFDWTLDEHLIIIQCQTKVLQVVYVQGLDLEVIFKRSMLPSSTDMYVISRNVYFTIYHIHIFVFILRLQTQLNYWNYWVWISKKFP